VSKMDTKIKIYIAADDPFCGKVLLKRWKLRDSSCYEHIIYQQRGTCCKCYKFLHCTNPEIVFHIKREIARSKNFQRGFMYWLAAMISSLKKSAHKCKWKPLSYNGQLSSVYGSIMEHMNALVKSTRLLYILKATEPITLRMNKDILWWCKLHPLIVNRIQLEYIMACLSTLGGAHSSLGDFSQHHSFQAGLISLRQFKVATQLNDPILSARCKIFLAHSLMQRNELKKARQIIRSQYEFSQSTKAEGKELLVTCCRAAWSRLQYLHRLKRERRSRDG